jgi:hemerythrin
MGTWTESLSIGLPLIDMQHKQLLDQLDALAEALRNGKGERELKCILKFLDMYVAQHFGYEESCMHRYECPVAQLNQNAHQQFVARVQKLTQDIEQKGASPRLGTRVQQELSNWFISHIQMVDTKLKTAVQPPVS